MRGRDQLSNGAGDLVSNIGHVRVDPEILRKVGFHARACAVPAEEVISRILRAHFESLEAEPEAPVLLPAPAPDPADAAPSPPVLPIGPIGRYSTRGGRLLDTFLRERLKGASELDRISGYFRSTLLHAISGDLSGLVKARLLCNAELDPRDILTARIARGADEALPKGDRFRTLLDLLRSGLVEIRVITEKGAPFLHGKAGVIRYPDGRACTFSGSANDTLAAWTDNYEIVWEDFSGEASEWFMGDFSDLWERSTPLHLATSTLVELPSGKLAAILPDGEGQEEVEIAPPSPPNDQVDEKRLPDLPDLSNASVLELLIGGETLTGPSPTQILSGALYQLDARLRTGPQQTAKLAWIHVGLQLSPDRDQQLHHDDRLHVSYAAPDLKSSILCAWRVARAIGERMQVDLVTQDGQISRLTYDPNEVFTFDRDEKFRNPLHERPLVGPGMMFRVLYIDEGRFETCYVLRGERDRLVGRDINRLGGGAPLVKELTDRMSGERAILNVNNVKTPIRLLDVWQPHHPDWA